MSCPTVSALVTSGICAKCECHGECKIEKIVIEQLKGGLKLVTIRDAIDIYTRRYRANEKVKSVRATGFIHDTELMGVAIDMPLCELSEDKFDKLVEEMHKDGASQKGRAYRDETIKSHLEAWKFLDGDRMRKLYQKEEFDLMTPIDVDYRKYGLKLNVIQQINISNITKLAEEMVLLKRGDRNQRNVYLYLFLALYVGLARVDILNAKWDNFKDTPNGKYYVAKRHKTGVEICVKITAQVWAMLDGFEKPQGEYMIILDKRGRKGERNGDKVGRRAGGVCKNCDIGGEYIGQKSGHALRKFKAQLVRSIYGVEVAAKTLGHSVGVDNRNYSSESSEFYLVAN